MNHRLAQFLCVDFLSNLQNRDFVSGPVVFQNPWMIREDICRSLFKIA